MLILLDVSIHVKISLWCADGAKQKSYRFIFGCQSYEGEPQWGYSMYKFIRCDLQLELKVKFSPGLPGGRTVEAIILFDCSTHTSLIQRFRTLTRTTSGYSYLLTR